MSFVLQPRRPLLGALSSYGEREESPRHNASVVVTEEDPRSSPSVVVAEEHPQCNPNLVVGEERPQSNTSVVVAGDMPHLGLRRGDILLEINGTKAGSCVECDRLMAVESGVSELCMRLFRWATCPDPALGLQDSLTEDLEDDIMPMPEYKPVGSLCCRVFGDHGGSNSCSGIR